MNYIRQKNLTNREVLPKYEDIIFRKLRWYAYINTMRSESKLLDKIEQIYGKKDKEGKLMRDKKGRLIKPISIILGDWSDNGRLKYISTPGDKLRRKLRERFNVFMMDEYKTSQLSYVTEEKCKNLTVPLKIKNPLDPSTFVMSRKELHAVLTYQNDVGQVCINRDKNAVLNMRKLVRNYIKNRERLVNFSRYKNNPQK